MWGPAGTLSGMDHTLSGVDSEACAAAPGLAWDCGPGLAVPRLAGPVRVGQGRRSRSRQPRTRRPASVEEVEIVDDPDDFPRSLEISTNWGVRIGE